MAAVAYIRRSASGEAQASEETQRETVARLAAQRGDTIARVFRDWGKSGGDEARPGYLAMMAEAEAGRLSAIYAYDQDRLARDNWIFAGLLRSADRHGFAIITPAGDLASEDRRDFVEMRGVMDGGELRKITKRNRAVLARCRARGDAYGAVPFGYVRRTPKLDGSERVEIVKANPEAIRHVVDAYRAEGSYIGAARRLNAEGFTSDRGKEWHSTTVRAVVQREAPELVKDVRKGTRGPARKRFLAGILRCHCGNVMTPGGALDWPLYYCGRGQRGQHGKPHHVAEKVLLPWMMAEAARLAVPYDRAIAGEDAEGRRAELEAERERVILLFTKGTITEARMDAMLVDVDAALGQLGDAAAVVELPGPIEWETDPPEAVNGVLRALWRHVQLGPDLLPVSADWRVPQWRA